MKIQLEDAFLMVIDIQEKLFPHINDKDELEKNLIKLFKGLKILDVPFVLNEQYKKGLGETIPSLKEILDTEESFEKVTFSCCKNESALVHILSLNKGKAIVAGIEAHICVMQTCLDLIEKNICPILVVDCIGSRKELDKEIAVKRLEREGVILTTSEALLFELCQSAKHPQFKEISKIVK